MPNRMDSIVSHGMGKMKGVKARLSGLVGVFKTLAEQHGEVLSLIDRAKNSDDKFRELWPDIRRELVSHEKAELRVLFPELRMYGELRALADQHDAAAQDLEQMIVELDDLQVGTQEFGDAYARFADAVREHADDEEKVIFPKAQQVIGRPRAEALVAPFLDAKKEMSIVV
jgi:hemerythrin superfamily protein